MTTAITVYDPRFLSWERWSSLMNSVHLQAGPGVEQPTPESKWREWAEQFIGAPSNAGLNLPQPYGYSGWRQWAYAINAVFHLGSP